MKEGFVWVNSVPTHVFTWGQWIEDEFDEKMKEIVLVVSGNPGLAGYYTQFCSTLFDEFDKKIPVWAIGHAGHDEPESKLQMVTPPLEGNENLYTLRGQVEHKIDFIMKYIPKGVKVHLVSHSIGSKISLELMKDENVSNKIEHLHSYLLFPTIEKMIESPNGYLFHRFFNKIFFILRFIYYAFSFLPLNVRIVILYFYCLLSRYPKFFLGTVVKTSSPTVLDKIWFMTNDELEKVRDIDREVINKNLHRLSFYYGTTDGWVPKTFYHKLIETFPGINAELCTQKIDHAFVISHGPTMARMVSDWIKRRKLLS